MLIQLNLINALAKFSSIFFNKEDIRHLNTILLAMISKVYFPVVGNLYGL